MSGSDQESTHRAIERVARESYGRLVAYLSSHTRDVASAEDALSNALAVSFATREVNDVPILFSNHGTDRCRYGFYRRPGGVGRENVAQEERCNRNHSELA